VWLGYNQKSDCLSKLKSNFEEGQDFLASRLKTAGAGRPRLCVMLTVDCFKSMGMMVGTTQGKNIRKYFLECERIAKAKFAPPFWYQRLMLDQKTNPVPRGYFSIFREVIPLVAELETAGYVLPDNSVPDISVGLRWATHLRSKNIVVEHVAKQYPHTYPDKRNIQYCNCYPESMLADFREWFRDKYKTTYLKEYIKTKDKAALAIVDKIAKILTE
jgi:phage anti-repressor protein